MGEDTAAQNDEGRTEVGSTSKFPAMIPAPSSQYLRKWPAWPLNFEHHFQLVTAQSQEDACSKLIYKFSCEKSFFRTLGYVGRPAVGKWMTCDVWLRRDRGGGGWKSFCWFPEAKSTAGEVAGSRWQGLTEWVWEVLGTSGPLDVFSIVAPTGCFWKISFRLVLQVALLLLVQVQLLGHGNARNKTRQKIKSRWTCRVYIYIYIYNTCIPQKL